MSFITQNLPQAKPASRSAFRTWWEKYEVAWWPSAIVAVGVIVLIAQHYSHLNHLVRH